jgi:hypothetical protein
MFIAAYFVARFLWIPLLACWAAAKNAPARKAMWLPIAAGIVATIWELVIPVSANIRIDLFLVAPVLMFADGVAGILLATAAYRQRKATHAFNPAIAAAAAMCLAACAFFAFAWGYSTWRAEDQYKEHVEGSRYYFEGAFRDAETQRSAFGSLEGTRWAGYYVSDPPQVSFAHLVVNAEGDYFLYASDFYERRGRTKPDPADPALATGVAMYLGIVTRATVEMRDLGDGRLQFQLRDGSSPGVVFVKRAPPRFPRPASAHDEVRFIGVFSGSYDEQAKYVALAQVWLWASEGRLWGVWLRGSFSREHEQPVFANSRADVTCADEECATLLVHTEGGRREKLQRQGPHALGWFERKDRLVTLNRGETVTGLPFAWAPLTTMEENRKWLRSVHPDITWQAPAKAPAK